MSNNPRVQYFRALMEVKGLSAILITDPFNQHYVSGFKAILYSRPIFYLITPTETTLIVPGLEEKHARLHSNVDNIHVYYEHPEKAELGTDPARTLLGCLAACGSEGRLGVEFHSVPIKLEKALHAAGWELVDISELVMGKRAVKDVDEQGLLRQAGKLVSMAVMSSLAEVKAGISELEMDHYGNKAVLQEVSRLYPDAVVALGVMSPSGVERTLLPHVFSNTRKLEHGDVVIHTRQLSLNGYIAECERTFFVGEASERQKEAFAVMVAAQQAALATIKAGVPMSEVDRAARTLIQQAGFGEYAIHRTGHSIGLAPHEPPFFRFDEHAPLQEGMVFTVEPGFYVPGIGGFRHSDTVIITKDGYEMITEGPRDLETLTL